MNIDVQIRNYLIDGLDIDQRIYPQVVPADPVYPLVVYSTTAGPHEGHRDGGSLVAMSKQYKIYGTGHNQVWAVAWDVRDRLVKWPMMIDNMIDGFESESGRFFVMIYATVYTRGE